MGSTLPHQGIWLRRWCASEVRWVLCCVDCNANDAFIWGKERKTVDLPNLWAALNWLLSEVQEVLLTWGPGPSYLYPDLLMTLQPPPLLVSGSRVLCV